MWNVFAVQLWQFTFASSTSSPSLSHSRTSSHALWMSWDTASRVCGVCCRLCSNNSLAPLAPCPAPANSTTPDRRLTCMDSWHGYCPNQIRSLVLKYTTILSQICVYKHTLTGKLPRREVAPSLSKLLFMRHQQSKNVSHVFAKEKPQLYKVDSSNDALLSVQ